MKKQDPESFLPEDLVWAAGGHASDVVLTAMADGQIEIIPAVVLAHVDGCRACTTHLGNAALLSIHTGREIARVAPKGAGQLASSPTPVPRLAIALGLIVAVVGLLPSLLDGRSTFGGAKRFAIHDMPLFVSGIGTLGRRLLEPGSPIGLGLTYGAATLLVIMAFAFVRLLPKKEVSR